MCTLLRLRDEHPSLPPPDELFRCANLVYGWYDLGGTPSMRAFDRRLVFCSEVRVILTMLTILTMPTTYSTHYTYYTYYTYFLLPHLTLTSLTTLTTYYTYYTY